MIKLEVAALFDGPNNRHGRMDFRHDLAKIAYPVLMMPGEDPHPFSSSDGRCWGLIEQEAAIGRLLRTCIAYNILTEFLMCRKDYVSDACFRLS